MNRYLFILPIWLSSLTMADGLEYKGNFSMEASYLDHDLDGKRDNEHAFQLEAEVQQPFESGKAVANLKAVYDLHDHERRYLDFNDLYYQQNFDDGDLLIGRNTRFWGAMEFYNHTDVFNTKDWLDNPFDYDSKIGADNIAYTRYLDNGEISVIAKVHEESQRVADQEAVNTFLPPFYNDRLVTQEDRNRPTLYLKYNASGEETQIDYALIYQNGYDEQRYLAPVGLSLQQHAYIVNKVMGYATLVSGDMLYKTELAYTQSEENLVSDYAQMSLGAEYTLYGLWDQKDLGLLLEYYRYRAFDGEKLGAEDFGNLFANDLAFGFRVSMNDTADSEILGGIDIDQENAEQIVFVEYKTRLFDSYKLELRYQHLEPKVDSLFPKLDRATVAFGYYF